MSVLVDTPVWSAALRKRLAPEAESVVSEFSKLLYQGVAILPGIIRQEVLSGIADAAQFRKIRDQLRDFEDFPIERDDHELAAELFTRCRSKGVQGSHTDFLLCALSMRRDMPIFTTDKDFDLFSKHIKIHLHHFSV